MAEPGSRASVGRRPTMATQTKKPRRTAERILDTTLELFNRFGAAERLDDADLGRARHQPGQPLLPLPCQGRAGHEALRPLRRGAHRAAARRRRRPRRRGRVALLPHAVRADLVVPLLLPRPQRPALEQPQARDALQVRPRAQDARRAGGARRHRRRQRPRDRAARCGDGGDRDGRRPHLLAELRVRARPAQGARAGGARAPRCCAARSTC